MSETTESLTNVEPSPVRKHHAPKQVKPLAPEQPQLAKSAMDTLNEKVSALMSEISAAAVKEVAGLDADQTCQRIFNHDISFEALANHLLFLKGNDKKAAMAYLASYLKGLFPDFNVRGKATAKGERLYPAQRAYNNLAYQYREHKRGKAEEEKKEESRIENTQPVQDLSSHIATRTTNHSIDLVGFIAAAREYSIHTAKSWISEFVAVLLPAERDELKRLIAAPAHTARHREHKPKQAATA